MGKGVNGWNELGVVGTIYEEEEEETLSSSSSSSTVPSLQFTPISSSPWKLRGRDSPDVVIHVQDSCFRLHKAALTSKSVFLRHRLSEFPEITLSPPLNITAQTFSMVTEFCYGAHVAVTPHNVVALRTAAELLSMTELYGDGGRSLQQITEEYFRREVAANEEYLSVVLTSCFSFLPEAETEASLVSRCVEALSVSAAPGSEGDWSCLDGFKGLSIDDFQMIMGSVSQRLTDCHDLLYRIIDHYLKAHIDWLPEEWKLQTCTHIDCTLLSPVLLMHTVRNPRMPLRFVVQAMFLHQLTTRDSLISSSAAANNLHPTREQKDAVTLGAILHREKALCHVSHLRAAMAATGSRIRSLERELSSMRATLDEPGPGPEGAFVSARARASSFRLSSKVERGQRGSVSARSMRTAVKAGDVVSSSDGSSSEGWPRVETSFGRRLVRGIKGAFGLRPKKSVSDGAEDRAFRRSSGYRS